MGGSLTPLSAVCSAVLPDGRPIDAPPTIINGGARGADSFAAVAARELNLPVECYPADWATYGKHAGFIRNEQMLDTGVDRVIAFWNGQSHGTQHTIESAKRRGIPVEVHME